MHVLFLTGEYPPTLSGIGDYTHLLANHLALQDVKVSVLTKIVDRKKIERDGLVQVFHQINKWNESAKPELKKVIEAIQPNVIHIQFHTVSFDQNLFIHFLPTWVKKNYPQIKVVVTMHEFAAPFLKLANLPLLLACERMVITNDRDMKKLKPLLPQVWRESHLRHIRMGTNIPQVKMAPEDFDGIRKKYNLKKDDFIATRFGFLNEANLDLVKLLLEVTAQVSKQVAFKLFLIGKVNEEVRKQISKTIRELHLSDHVVLLSGASPAEVSGVLQISDIGFAPYSDGISERRGGFIALISHGLPVITNVGAFVPELHEHGVNVIHLQAAYECNVWVQATLELIREHSLRKAVSQGALKLYENYRWEKCAADSLSLYKACLVEGPHAA